MGNLTFQWLKGGREPGRDPVTIRFEEGNRRTMPSDAYGQLKMTRRDRKYQLLTLARSDSAALHSLIVEVLTDLDEDATQHLLGVVALRKAEARTKQPEQV